MFENVLKGRPKLMVLIAIWIMFAAPIGVSFMLFNLIVGDLTSMNLFVSTGLLLVTMLLNVVIAIVPYRATIRYFSYREEKDDSEESQSAGRRVMTDYFELVRMMPSNWDDQQGWDRYYRSYCDAKYHLDKNLVTFSLGVQVYPVIGIVQKLGLRSIWLPGCGVSIAPRLLNDLGADTFASDFSSVAFGVQYEFQRMTANDLAKIDELFGKLAQEASAYQNANYVVFHHDFRTPFPHAPVDCILNVIAFQELPPESMALAAKVHFDALRPSGHVFFVTQDVQGDRRDLIEDCLSSAGFQIPNYHVNKAYRARLRETGIPHIFKSGRPILDPLKYRGIPRILEGEEHSRILFKIAQEFEARIEQDHQNQTSERAVCTAKTAHVIYNEG